MLREATARATRGQAKRKGPTLVPEAAPPTPKNRVGTDSATESAAPRR